MIPTICHYEKGKSIEIVKRSVVTSGWELGGGEGGIVNQPLKKLI